MTAIEACAVGLVAAVAVGGSALWSGARRSGRWLEFPARVKDAGRGGSNRRGAEARDPHARDR